METVKLYYEDAFMKRFTGRVETCREHKGQYLVVLDRTAFYPEGGGQPADHGTLGPARVLDVHEREGQIVHTCDRPLPEGETVEGTLDWARRFDHMQQHSGEHIVSGMLCETFHCDNVGFHMGESVVTIDYNAPLTWEQVLEVEARANRYLWEDHPIEITWPDRETLASIAYRSKKALEGPVRLTGFPGADLCACCGTHVKSSGQVGLVKFLSCQRFRDGVRLELLCGQRALDALSGSWEQNRQVGQALSVKPEKTAAAVERLRQELAETREQLAHLEEEQFLRLAEEHRGERDVVLVRGPLRGDGVRRLCDALTRTACGRCAVFAGTEGSYQYAVISPGQDIRAMVKELNQALHGRGGGRDGFAQGSAACTEAEIRAFFREKAPETEK